RSGVESCADQRPERAGARDRLLLAGGSVLSDVELLGLMLDAGAGTSAGLELAERVLGAAGGLARLDRLDRRACAPLGRLWPRRLALVRAALELGRRAAAEPLAAGDPVRDAAAVYAHFRGRLPQLEREVFYVLLLDGKNRVQGGVRVSEGSLTAAPAAAQELHALRDDLGDVAAVAFLVVVLAGADCALDVDLPALGQVLAAGLRLLAPHHHVVPLGAFLALTLGVVPHLAGRERETRHRAAARRETHLRILPE